MVGLSRRLGGYHHDSTNAPPNGDDGESRRDSAPIARVRPIVQCGP